MRLSARETAEANRLLGSKGLATLDDPRGLLQQLGFLVEGHDHFRQLLVKCTPEHRREMYESLRPHLGFEPHPLDVYIAEAGAIAERKQLPTIGPDGRLYPFHPPEVVSEDYRAAAQEALDAAMAKGALELVCRRCTKAAVFPGITRADAIHAARQAGWTYGLDTEGKGRELCPDCEKPLLSREDFRLVTEFKGQPPATIQRYMACPSASWTARDWDAHALEAARRWAADGRPPAGQVD